ncbi:hypothetical protein HYU09_03310 [Candidatus Woesearchaeota archaeon]|nr:hypothetical protein [Candidatus Woesearchaeota archaeon]
MMDIVMPRNNEGEFIKIAEKLGYSELLFLYGFDEYMEKQQIAKIQNSKIKISHGIIANDRNIQKINNKFRNKNIFVAMKSSFNNREIIEKSSANLIFSMEESGRKDFMHQRGSGLDHILAKLAHGKKIAVGFSLSSIVNSKNKNIILGRMMQNIMLCRKYKVKTVIASLAENPYGMRSPYDLMSLFITLGMRQEDTKDSLHL